ncbi:MAG: hypothetical protein ACO1NZ_18160, partial [Adhaeribacter sp.]
MLVVITPTTAVRKILKQFNNSTIQQFSNSAIQQFNNPTIHQFYLPQQHHVAFVVFLGAVADFYFKLV